MNKEVPSEWPEGKQVNLGFIGEAPGQNEVEDGRPFVGSAGRTFDKLLRAANINRGDCYIGNVFSTKLENNNVEDEKKKQGAAWGEFEKWNIARMAGELAIVNPRLVVALGETPLRYLTGLTWTVGSVRGTLRPGAGLFADWRIFTTFHPAFIKRLWKMFVPTVADLIKANALAATPKELPKRKLNVAPSIQEVKEFLYGKCAKTDLLSIDIETAHKVGIIKGISFAPNQFEAIYVPFAANTPNGSYWGTPEQEAMAWKACKETCENDVPKLGQNFGLYDLPWLWEKAGIYVKNYREDLMICHKVLFPELPASLEFIAGCYSEQGPWKSSLRKSNDGKKEE